jgi:hypothetical protein
MRLTTGQRIEIGTNEVSYLARFDTAESVGDAEDGRVGDPGHRLDGELVAVNGDVAGCRVASGAVDDGASVQSQAHPVGERATAAVMGCAPAQRRIPGPRT